MHNRARSGAVQQTYNATRYGAAAQYESDRRRRERPAFEYTVATKYVWRSNVLCPDYSARKIEGTSLNLALLFPCRRVRVDDKSDSQPPRLTWHRFAASSNRQVTLCYRSSTYVTSGNLSAAASGPTDGRIMHLPPFTQSAGVAKLWVAVSWRESIVRMI